MPNALQLRSSLVEEIQDFIAQNEIFEAEVNVGLELLVETYAHTITASAQKRSKGILDPTQAYKQFAWIIPVRRITGAYYAGWKDEQMTPLTWRVYNMSREAYFIEFGINPRTTKRIRRPVLKLSVNDAIEFYDGMKTMSSMVGGAWSFTSTGGPHLTGTSIYAAGTIGVARRVSAGPTRVFSGAD